MHQLKRSTDERVVARHHVLSKRLPAQALPPGGISSGDGNTIPIPPNPAPAPVVNPGPPPPPPPPPATPSPHLPVPPNPVPVPAPHPLTPDHPPPVATTIPKPVQTPISSASPVPSSVIVNTPIRDLTSKPSATKAADVSHSPTATTSPKDSKGISSGAVGGIVAILLIVTVIVGALFVRKMYQRRRDIKRNTWGAGLVPSLENKRQTLYGNEEKSHGYPSDDVPDHKRLPSIPRSEMPNKRALHVPSALASATFPKANHVSIPASAYNTTSPISPFAPPAPSVRTSQTEAASPPVPSGDVAVVARTFIPSLPDELQISNGEQIRILSAFDDGWALCVNSRGEQGVVPLECLDKRNGAPLEMQLQPFSGVGPEANRASRRLSSLAPSAKGTY